MGKLVNWILWIIGVLTVVVSGFFIYFCLTRFAITGPRGVKWDVTGQVGDFVGGVIGTLVSILGFILVYLSLESQKKADARQDRQFEKSQIENRFIELIKLHKENLYDIYIERNDKQIKERKAIDFIIGQVTDCYHEIARFFVKAEAEKIYATNYLNKTNEFVLRRTDINLIHLAHIDIAYSLVFFGTSYEDLQSLGKLFKESYNEDFIRKIILFIRLKPFDEKKLKDWNELVKTKADANLIIKKIELYNSGKPIRTLNEEEPEFLTPLNALLKTQKQQKYYGGHQYKLGQYFRHLFQTVKYINDNKILTYNEKYGYIKTLRAQLSTIEQYLIFYNSISFMGRPWELSFVKSGDEKEINEWYITKYNFIKNIPDLCLLENVNILDYYPDMNFEFVKEPLSRGPLKAKFR